MSREIQSSGNPVHESSSSSNIGTSTLHSVSDGHLDSFFEHQLRATKSRLNSPEFMKRLADVQFKSEGDGKRHAHELVQKETDAVWEDLKPELRVLYEDFDKDGNHSLDENECELLLMVYLPKAKKIQTIVAVQQVRNLLPKLIEGCVDSLGNSGTLLTYEDISDIVLHMFEEEYIPIVEQAYDEMFKKLGESSSAVASEMFAAMDTNHDGKVDVEEFITGFASAMKEVTNNPARTQRIGDSIEPAMRNLMLGMMKQLHDADHRRREEQRANRSGGCCILQ